LPALVVFIGTKKLIVNENYADTAFPLSYKNINPVIYYDAADAKVISIAANMFAEDVKASTGRNIALSSSQSITADYAIVVGTVAHSTLIQSFSKKKMIDVSALKNKWEQFSIFTINQSAKKYWLLLEVTEEGQHMV